MRLAIFSILCNVFICCAQDFQTRVEAGEYHQSYSITINKSIEYIYLFERKNSFVPSRVTVSSKNASRQYPILVVVRQQKEVLSWQIPLLVDIKNADVEFTNTSRTLCPDNMQVLISRTQDDLLDWKALSHDTGQTNLSNLIISVSTSSPEDIRLSLYLEFEEDFYITHSKLYNTTVSPSEPKYFFYRFDKNSSLDNTSTVILKVNSDDNVCMFISIQKSSCPVYDLEHDIRFEGLWETIDHQGGINLSQTKFPNGFFLLFVSKSDDFDCTGTTTSGISHRRKNIKFTITISISYNDYINAVIATVGAIAAFYVIFLLLLCFCSRGAYKPMTMDSVVTAESVPTPTTPTTLFGDIMSPDFNDNSSMDETEYDTIREAESVRNIYRSKGTLCLSDLARKDPRILNKKSYLYLWHVITVAVFYGLPVVQLVVTYQKVLRETGNQDLCYYNFLCAHPLGIISDFNHFFSNIGYIMLGFLFLLLTYRRERMHKDNNFDRHFGIPQHYGLFYAMGIALMMEGILSASYHLCPNHSNFQFDTSFMYVMGVLIMVKLYQNRHPDINARANVTFLILAAAILLGMVGIMDGTVYFWILFTILHIVTCFLLTIQIYYMGCWSCDRDVFMRVFRTFANDFRSGPCNILKPDHKGRMILLSIGNICNWALAVIGLYHHEKDFATYLLAIFMTNTTLYTLFYVVMKLCHKETIKPQAVIFIILTILSWGAAMFYFIHKSISWALTPAQSRHYNQSCQLLMFYDPHDIWHFLSAAAMFFSFMVLLTLDDDLTHTHRSKIPVF